MNDALALDHSTVHVGLTCQMGQHVPWVTNVAASAFSNKKFPTKFFQHFWLEMHVHFCWEMFLLENLFVGQRLLLEQIFLLENLLLEELEDHCTGVCFGCCRTCSRPAPVRFWLELLV